MTWLIERVLDLLEWILNWAYGRKYGAMARRFGRGAAEDDGRRGLIMLQVDGLSYPILVKALDRGIMPHLKRLCDRDGYRLHRWWSGIPSSTPAVQGGLMYGQNDDVPAFRWYEKDMGRSMVAKKPRDARRLQDRLSRNRAGLLEGGSSYLNIFDGGARLTLFTVSALGGERFFENVRGVSFILLLLLNPVRLLRTVANVTWDFWRDLWHRLVGRIDTRVGPRRRSLSPVAALVQITASVTFRELQTFGILIDIYRRVPAIYANFYGYDEVAHHRGILDGETARVLRGIDGRIREIDTARRRFAARRAYDLFVLSDHGMSPCTAFKELYGQTLGEMLAAYVAREDEPVSLDERGDEDWRQDAEPQQLLAELEAIKEKLPPRGQRLATALHDFVARRVPPLPDEESDWDLSRRHDLLLLNSGSVSLVYFNLTPHQMDLSEIELLYPGLLRHLAEHPGLGLVLGREQGQAMAMTLRGPRRLSVSEPLVRDLLDNLPDRALVAGQLDRLVRFPAAGDLVIFGRWDAHGHVVAFEDHWATHGGVGGDQTIPFMLVPPAIDWDIAAITNPEELYPLFMARYGRS